MKAWLIHFFTTACTLALAGVAYDHWVVRPSQLIGIVDVGDVVHAKEVEFTQQIMRAGANDHQQALEAAQRFATRLPSALDELPRDCQCLVLVRSSLAGVPPHAIDLTAQLKHKVELP